MGKDKKLKRLSLTKSPILTANRIVFKNFAKESHSNPLFGISFNHYVKAEIGMLFCCVGGNYATVYLCHHNGQLKKLDTIIDDDPSEIYYCSTWTFDEQDIPILILGGGKAVIRVLPLNNIYESWHILGHGHSINDLKIHPKHQDVVLSASKDHSLRLWNIQTKTCIAIFSGVDGHRDEVISCDFHPQGHLILSTGMDHSIKIWDLGTQSILEAIKMAKLFKGVEYGARKSFPTVLCHFPIFTTRDIHKNYIDSALWFGNLIFSKACESAITCWKVGSLDPARLNLTGDLDMNDDSDLNSPHTQQKLIEAFELTVGPHQSDIKPQDKAQKLFELPYADGDLWYMRMAIDPLYKLIAVGNSVGKIYIWNLDNFDMENQQLQILKHPSCKSAIRQLAFSSVMPCSDTQTNHRPSQKTPSPTKPADTKSPSSQNVSPNIQTITDTSPNGPSTGETIDSSITPQTISLNPINPTKYYTSLVAVSDDATVWRWDYYYI